MRKKAAKTKPLTAAETKIVEENGGLIGKAMKRRACVRLPVEDQQQEGVIALIKAARGFKEDRGFQFSTYAVNTIKNELWKHDWLDGLIRIPYGVNPDSCKNPRLLEYAESARRRTSLGDAMESGWEPQAPEEEESEFGYRAMRAVRWAICKLSPIERRFIREVVLRNENPVRFRAKNGLSYYQAAKVKKSAFAKLRATLAKHV